MKQASNFGVALNTLVGPTTHEHLSDVDRQGHELATLYMNESVSRGSMDLLIALRGLLDTVDKDGLERDDLYGLVRVRKALTVDELNVKLVKEQKAWIEGLKAYLWIAADESNKLGIDKRFDYKTSGHAAYKFQTIAERMGYKLTPFWELEYETWTGWENVPDDLSVEHFSFEKGPIEGKVLES